MFFLNLTAGEFLALLGVLGGAITALYFLDRSKKRRVVSSLQFWVPAAGTTEQSSRKKVNQPWSLILQLVSLALLLLAIAQLQWGSRAAAGRDHVLLLDTSSWSQAKTATGSALEREKAAASDYIARLPARDRVLLAHADALTTPVTLFTNDRAQLAAALRAAKSSFSALDVQNALTYARQAQRSSGGAPGEIVYIGPQWVGSDVANLDLPNNLRVLECPVSGPNVGIRRLEVFRDEADPNSWHAQIALMNYKEPAQAVKLQTQFAGTHFAVRPYLLSPHQEVTAEYAFTTNTKGRLTAQLDTTDALLADNESSLELPGAATYAVVVYTRRADLFRPLFNADRRISATYLDPTQQSSKIHADLVILDGTSLPLSQLHAPSIWINPSDPGSPFRIKTAISKAAISGWNSEVLMSAGLHAHEEAIPQAKIFSPQPEDVTLASVSSGAVAGPLVVLRPDTANGFKMAAIGFDPLDSRLRFSVTTPLLFANLLEWMAPEAVRATELTAGHVGAASVSLDPSESAQSIKVVAEDGSSLPFTVHEKTLQLFASRPTTVRIVSATRTRMLSLMLPDVAQVQWSATSPDIAKGLPALASAVGSSVDLWQWLACLGAAGLLAEWLLFGRSRLVIRATPKSSSPVSAREQAHDQMVVR